MSAPTAGPVSGLRARLREPAIPGLLLFIAVAAGGFVAISIGWRVAARTLFVPGQLPALVSGGFGGLALVLLGLGLVTVHESRRIAAEERVAFEGLLDEASALVAVVKEA